MRKLEIRGGKIIDGDLGTPKGFHLFCTEGVGLLTCDTFATAAYISAENRLYGHSVRVASNTSDNETARMILLADTCSDVMQKGGRGRVINCVNYASDKLLLPSSKLRPFFIGELIERVDNDTIMRGIDACVLALKSGQTANLSAMKAHHYSKTVQFFLGDDYLCTLSGTVFTDEKCPLTKRSVIITTDVAISADMLDLALFTSVRETFGLLNIPASVNDGYAVFASGCSGNYQISARDSEFSKFSRAMDFLLNELCGMLVSGDCDEEGIQLFVENAKSKTLAWDVVKNTSVYFSLVGNEDCSLLKGLLTCVGNVETALRRRRMRIWLSSDVGRVLLVDEARVLYIVPEKLKEVLAGTNAAVTVDFREGIFGASGWIKKMDRKVIN